MTTPTQKRSRGRPRSAMTAENVCALLKLVEQGNRPERAAAALGLSPAAMRKHKARHPEFVTDLARAAAVAESSLVAIIQRAARKGDLSSARWLLERRFRARWGREEPAVRVTAIATSQSTADEKLWRAAIATVPGFTPSLQPPKPPAPPPPPPENPE
jgi:hypothetical protein